MSARPYRSPGCGGAVGGRWAGSLALLALVWLLLTALVGCVRRSQPYHEGAGNVAARPINNLALGIDSVRNAIATLPENRPGLALDGFNQSRALFYFNQWLARQDLSATTFTPDPLVRGLPAVVREHPLLAQLALGQRKQFFGSDIVYLQQCLWMNDIATRIGSLPPDPAWSAWLAQQEQALGIEPARQLRQALALFDWTIRSIQLDELPPAAQGPVATAGNAPAAQQLPALRGVPGPGYRQLPLQTLLHGHGDAHERGRVFILLCRQLQIPVVMLGLVDPQQSGPPTPWAAAALVGGKLFLFDPALGLPLPGAGGGGVATLDDLAEQPALLRQLDVADGPAYPVTEQALSQGVAALLDADPDALSQRIALLEGPLNQARREALQTRVAAGVAEAGETLPNLVLSFRPSELAAPLRKLRKISAASIWRTPIDAVFFQYGSQQQPQPSADYFARFHDRELPAALIKARDLQFRGQLDRVDLKPGAREIYFHFRRSDQEIDSLETSAEARRAAPGLQQFLDQAKNEQELQRILRAFTANAYRIKERTTYWLSLTYVDQGDREAALEWFRDRALVDKTGDNLWLPSARYNLARCLEAAGQTAAARELYLADTSPQRHGNLLRAQRLAAAAPQ